jgi:prepilin-type N-terminal cleavage/methylation domain-containing protein
MKHKTHKHGFTLIELLVVMSIIALLLSILMPALGRARAEAMLAKDQSQVKSIFSGFSFWAPSHNGNYPIPGLEQRLENPNGQLIQGRGPEDLERNDHASMLSMCIMQNLFSPDVLFAPTESSEFVEPMEEYDYEQYNPKNTNATNPDVNAWTFWDVLFDNDLEQHCNNSYGIMPLTGKRKHQNWCISTHNPMSYAVVGTRGPVDGIQSATSTTNLFHGIERDWKGVVTFGDGHTEILDTFYPMASTYLLEGGGSEPDNIFEEADGDPSPMQAQDVDYMPSGFEQGQGADIILTHVRKDDVTADGKGGACSEYLHD